MKKDSFYENARKKSIEADRAYTTMRRECDSVATLAKECIDWTDEVYCEYLMGDGVCIAVDVMIVPASWFFLEAENSGGMVSRERFKKLAI